MYGYWQSRHRYQDGTFTCSKKIPSFIYLHSETAKKNQVLNQAGFSLFLKRSTIWHSLLKLIVLFKLNVQLSGLIRFFWNWLLFAIYHKDIYSSKRVFMTSRHKVLFFLSDPFGDLICFPCFSKNFSFCANRSFV